MKNFSEMSKLSQEVAENIDEQLYDCKEDCKKGRLSGDMYECVIRTVLNTMDNWTPRLNMRPDVRSLTGFSLSMVFAYKED